MKNVLAGVKAYARDPFNRLFLAGLGGLVILGAGLRAQGFSSGTLFRDDAWVALTSKISLGTAWHMVGTAPGFVIIERWWVQIAGSQLWLMQLPTFLVSVLGLVLVGVVARWWRLSRTAALFVVALLAFSRIDVTYATHLKPYAHDIVAAALLLAAARWFQRGGEAFWFAGFAALCLITSFSVLPLVIGLSVWMVVLAYRTHRTASLVIPAAIGVLPVGVVAWAIRQGVSPRLDVSWQGSYVDYSSLSSGLQSLNSITTGLLSGIFDTAPGLGIAYLGRAIQLAAIGLILLSLRRLKDSAVLWATLLGAYGACLVHLAPLGTGRTDAYLHPTIALLVVIGGVELAHLARRYFSAAPALILILTSLPVGLSGLDRLLHSAPYAGGDFRPIVSQARSMVVSGGAVIIEGTARWPWAFYGARQLSIKFSPLYNTGFAPVSNDPRIVLMPGSSIEGGYSPARAVAALNGATSVLYVQSDDWPDMGHPLNSALQSAGYFPNTPLRHQPGYFTQLWLKKSNPTVRP